jgi:hypothetical protein
MKLKREREQEIPVDDIGILIVVSGFASVIGLVVSTALIQYETPVLVNQYVTVWFSTMACYSSLQTFNVYKYRDGYRSNVLCKYTNMLYGTLLSLMALACFVGYVILDEAGGVIFNLLVFWLNAVLAISLRGKIKSPESRSTSKNNKMVVVFNGILKIAQVVLYVLLTNGALLQVYIKFKYPPPVPGTVKRITLADNRTTTMHLRCVGEKNASGHVIWIDSGPNRGVADLIGWQDALGNKGQRVCTMDYPGYGWSGPLLKGQQDPMLHIGSLIQASEEATPMIFVGLGEGGSAVVEYSHRNSSHVAGIILLETYPPETVYADQEIQERIVSLSLSLSLTVPLGLSNPIVFGGSFAENNVSSMLSSEWVSQYWGLRNLQLIRQKGDPQETLHIDSDIPLVIRNCAPSEKVLCQDKSHNECDKLIEKGKSAVEMANALQPNSTRLPIDVANCSLDMAILHPDLAANLTLVAIKEVEFIIIEKGKLPITDDLYKRPIARDELRK